MVKSVYMASMAAGSIEFGVFFYIILVIGMPAQAAVTVKAQNNE